MSGEGDRLVLSSTSFPQSRGRVTWVTGMEKIHKNLRRMVVGMWVFAGFLLGFLVNQVLEKMEKRHILTSETKKNKDRKGNTHILAKKEWKRLGPVRMILK